MWLGSCLEFMSRLCIPKALSLSPVLTREIRNFPLLEQQNGKSTTPGGTECGRVARYVFYGNWHVFQTGCVSSKAGLGAELGAQAICGCLEKMS